MKNWKPSRPAVVAFVLIGGFLLLAILLRGFYSFSNLKTKTTFALANGKQVRLALKTYAEDHKGRMPDKLDELTGNYVPDVHNLGFCYDITFHRLYCDWLYFRRSSFSQASPKNILLAAPWGLEEAEFRSAKRVVILFDGSAELLSEDDFRARITRELRAQP